MGHCIFQIYPWWLVLMLKRSLGICLYLPIILPTENLDSSFFQSSPSIRWMHSLVDFSMYCLVRIGVASFLVSSIHLHFYYNIHSYGWCQYCDMNHSDSLPNHAECLRRSFRLLPSSLLSSSLLPSLDSLHREIFSNTIPLTITISITLCYVSGCVSYEVLDQQ